MRGGRSGRAGELSVDGTKLRASASYDRNRGYASIVEEILDEAEQTDRAEDEQFGDARGDELPEQLRTREGRRAALAAAKERMQAEREARRDEGEQIVADVELELDPERFVTRPEGRRAWLREGRRALEAQRDREAREMPLGRQDRIDEVKRRFDEELAFTHAANRCYEQYRAKGRMRDGRRFGAPPHPYEPPLVPEGKINTTDPDSSDRIYSGVPAGMFGKEQEIEVGHYSGESNVVYWLKKRGYEPTTELVAAVLGAAKRGNRVLTDDEIVAVVKDARTA